MPETGEEGDGVRTRAEESAAVALAVLDKNLNIPKEIIAAGNYCR